MPSKLNEYEDLIKKSLELGYTHITIREYYHKLKENTLGSKKYFLHRHDIDTDTKTAKKMFEIEKKYDVKTTSYFRLSTLDINLMKMIDSYGSEASYHFEEIATYCKSNHIKSKEKALEKITDIRQLFINNVETVETKSGIKIRTVASHGDFVNRKLRIQNNEITKDIKLRNYLSLTCEAYDNDLQNSFDVYVKDGMYPKKYIPIIFDTLGKYNTICFLTHARYWNIHILTNLQDSLKRAYEGLRW